MCSPEKSLHTLGLSFLWRQGSLQHTLPGLTVQCKVDQQRGPLRVGRGQGVALALETVPLCLFLIGDTVIFLELGDLLGRKGEAFLGQEGVPTNPFVSQDLLCLIPKTPGSPLKFQEKTAKNLTPLPGDRGFPR